MYPADDDLIFFEILRLKKKKFKYFQASKQTIFTPKGKLNVSSSLGHMLMPSAERWADNQC